MRALNSISMKNRGVVFGVVLMCVSCSVAFGQPWVGSGDANDPYQIWTAEDMQAIGADAIYWDAHFKLMADIDLSAYTGTGFNNIGNSTTAFSGVFDGNGHTISNLTDEYGLFRDVSYGTIQDLGLIDPNICGEAGTGSDRGSLVGKLYRSTVSGCYVEGGRVAEGVYVGGLVGSNYHNNIINCYSSANVSGNYRVGGLVGENGSGTITGCHSTGQIQGQDLSGGLVGYNSGGTVINCYSTSSVSGYSQVGGLVGGGVGTVYYSYSTGSVSGTASVGGLVGSAQSIYNCYSTGSVSGTTNVGGLVGYGFNKRITNCYSTGSVSGTTDVGGLVGIGGNSVYDSFWDIETSGEPNSAGGTGLTTAQMQDANTFLAAGWDFVGEYENGPNDEWAQGSGGGYMVLWWQLQENELPPLPTFSGGSGTKNDPYLISNATDLNLIGSNGRLMDKNFRLINDIDLTGIELFLIGSPWYVYSGVFDGDGHTISNFSYSCSGTDYVGLFRKVEGPDAEIRNLGLINPNIDAGTGNYVGTLAGRFYGAGISGCYVEDGSVTGGSGLVGSNSGAISDCSYIGVVSGGSGLVGSNGGTISNCYSGGSVSGDGNFGGLAAGNSGTIINCYSTSSFSGGGDYIGGLVGKNSGTITDCYATGSPTGHWNIGGLVGMNTSGSITNCYASGGASGSTTTAGNEAIGGLVGYLWSGGIVNCYSTGTVLGPAGDVGGLVGHSKGSITKCYSTGAVPSTSTSQHVGGLVGYNELGSITNCYARGIVSGGSSVGGLVGRNDATIYYSYSAGSVSGSDNVGGLVGARGLVLFSFWDTETSGQDFSVGGIGLPTALMQQEITFTNATWDFFYTWDICDGTNYPKLAWQVPVLGDFNCPDGVDWKDVAVLCEQWLLKELPWDIWPVQGDGIVNFYDWGVFAREWETAKDMAQLSDFSDQWLQTSVDHYIADIAPPPDGDGVVNGLDYAELAGNWLGGI